jgi:sigma-B regulation protein RsbU (phosphoserine phosphatase)
MPIHLFLHKTDCRAIFSLSAGGFVSPEVSMETALDAGEKIRFSDDIAQHGEERNPRNIQCYQPVHIHGEIIGKIARCFWFVDKDCVIDGLADELGTMDSVEAIGVVDSEGAVAGIVLRRELFDVLSQRYGRDIYKNKPVSALMKSVRRIDFKRNIYSIAEELSSELNLPQTTYYLLTTAGNRFAGIFSTRDLNIYLAGMLQKDMALAKKIQSGIVRDTEFHETSRVSVLGATRMAKGIGGDFYSIFEYEPGRWLINISDVSGKGVPASLVSVLLGGMFSLYDFKDGVEGFIVKLNSYLLRSFGGDRFVTSSFLDLDAAKGELGLFDMGHSYLFIVRDGSVIRVRSKGNNIPLGIIEECAPEKGKISLVPGDLLILCTDGFEEQKNPDGEEYGLNRFFKTILRKKARGLESIRDGIFADIDEFRENQPGSDDMTLVMIEFR